MSRLFLLVILVLGSAVPLSAEPASITLMTYNIRGALGGADAARNPIEARGRKLDLSSVVAAIRSAKADVIALQEVDGEAAARRVLADYQFCFSSRVSLQNNGFAIRRGLPFACGPELTELSLNDDVRRGVELRLFPGTPQEIRLLSVHLKSGCSRDPLNSTRPNCLQLASQVRALEQWIESQARAGIPFGLLGDFNRDLRREPSGPSLWGDLDDGDPPASDLVNTAEGKEFQNCSPAQTFTGYIDYILLGQRLARGMVTDSFGRALFRPKDALRRKLSDHCPVFIRLRVADATRDLS